MRKILRVRLRDSLRVRVAQAPLLGAPPLGPGAAGRPRGAPLYRQSVI